MEVQTDDNHYTMRKKTVNDLQFELFKVENVIEYRAHMKDNNCKYFNVS